MASGPSDPPATSAAEHFAAAEKFLRHAERLVALRADDALMPGWVIVAAFYASLHAITGHVVAAHNQRAQEHHDRSQWFRRFPELGPDRFVFQKLKNFSEAFRYYCEPYEWDTAEATLKDAKGLVSKWARRRR